MNAITDRLLPGIDGIDERSIDNRQNGGPSSDAWEESKEVGIQPWRR